MRPDRDMYLAQYLSGMYTRENGEAARSRLRSVTIIIIAKSKYIFREPHVY